MGRSSPQMYVNPDAQDVHIVSFWGDVSEDSAQFLPYTSDSNRTPIKCTCWSKREIVMNNMGRTTTIRLVGAVFSNIGMCQ